ncbi:hypothetical protein [Lewinella sp. IMCC34183]|uniref:hypothetical protein n=1 Tax=Lewinella sp. IMCC34183 TaxID=2248762 RepID=UPI000E26E630|nr:hypothetical protein [Lewinella sp. IMCC34183]
MKFRTCLFLLLSIIASSVGAQPAVQTEDNLFWQPTVVLAYADFQSPSDADCVQVNEKYGLQLSATIQLRGIVDVPESHLSKKIKRRTGDDKGYLAPVFCKHCSCMLSEDSTELVVYQLLFDVAEMTARGARKELLETQDQLKINNVNATFFTTVKNKWDERMRGTWASIYQEVLIQQKEGAYAEWRSLVDEILADMQDYATQPDDIERFIAGEPIMEGYVQAETIIGDLEKE